jgi:Carbohydrate binding domain (family 11)
MKSIFAVLGLLCMSACDAVRKDNVLDPQSPSYLPAKLTADVFPAGAGSARIERGSAADLDAKVVATAAVGWKFHHWNGREYTGNTSMLLPVHLLKGGDSLNVTASFVPDWTTSDSVLLDDFDAPDDFTPTGRHSTDLQLALLGTGVYQADISWTLSASSEAVVVPAAAQTIAGGDGDWRGTRVPGSGWDGKGCMRVTTRISNAQFGWANMNAPLRPWFVSQDLSKLRKISFWVKGSGTIQVGFNTILGMRLGDYSPLQSSKIILTSSWVRHEIDPSTLKFPKWCNAYGQPDADWAHQLTRMSNFRIDMISDTTDLWLDEVWLVGAPITEYMK